MAKSSFAGQLVKGFIRSAVNQVGRDSGKVVSNNMYGNRHSTPYRNSGNSNYNTENSSYISEGAESNGVFVDRIPPTSGTGVAIRIILAIFASFIGGIILIYFGINNLKKCNIITANVIAYQKGMSANQELSVIHKGKQFLEATDYEKSIKIRNGYSYLISGITIFIAFLLPLILRRWE